MISLITSPAKYQNKQIRVFGYLQWSFELHALSFDQEHSLDPTNALWLEPDPKLMVYPTGESLRSADKKYVIIDGVFDCGVKGQGAAWFAGVKNVTSITIVPKN